MADFAREAILHAFVAALVYAALVRGWRVSDPGSRLVLGVIALAWSAAGVPVLWLLAPGRTGESFRDDRAIFDSARWNDLQFAGTGLADAGVAVMVAAGGLLFLRDLIPWLHERRGGRPAPTPAAWPGSERLREMVERLASRMKIAPPPVHLLDDKEPVMLCAGGRRPVLVVSRGACDGLDEHALEAAVAHELAHVERRDAAAGWLLLAVRAACWFNPVVQVLARDLAQEIERRADDRAAAVAGDRVALAAALVSVFGAGEGRGRVATEWPVPWLDAPGRMADHFRAAALEARCRRLLAPPVAAPPPPVARLHAALTAAGLGLLLFHVV